MITHSENISQFVTALHAAQAEMGGVAKDSKNPHYKNSYASLEAVIGVAKPALSKHNLVFTQAPGALVHGALEVTTMIMHTSGEYLSTTLHVPLAKNDPQGVGSAITYACRYALMAVLGLPPVDDDAEAAALRTAPREPTMADRFFLEASQFISNCKSADDLKAWWKKESEARNRILDTEQMRALHDRFVERGKALTTVKEAA